MNEPCRFAATDPKHVCLDSFGQPVHGDKVCKSEASAQLRDKVDNARMKAAADVVPSGKDMAAGR